MSATDNVTPIRRGRPYVIGIPQDDLTLIRQSMDIDNKWRVQAGLEPHRLVGEYVYGVALNRLRDERCGRALTDAGITLGIGPVPKNLREARGVVEKIAYGSPATRWQRFRAWLAKLGMSA